VTAGLWCNESDRDLLQQQLNQFNQELASANGTAQTYRIDVAIFASIAVLLVAVVFTAFSIYQLRSKGSNSE
jgi:hypothetical protein